MSEQGKDSAGEGKDDDRAKRLRDRLSKLRSRRNLDSSADNVASSSSGAANDKDKTGTPAGAGESGAETPSDAQRKSLRISGSSPNLKNLSGKFPSTPSDNNEKKKLLQKMRDGKYFGIFNEEN